MTAKFIDMMLDRKFLPGKNLLAMWLPYLVQSRYWEEDFPIYLHDQYALYNMTRIQ